MREPRTRLWLRVERRVAPFVSRTVCVPGIVSAHAPSYLTEPPILASRKANPDGDDGVCLWVWLELELELELDKDEGRKGSCKNRISCALLFFCSLRIGSSCYAMLFLACLRYIGINVVDTRYMSLDKATARTFLGTCGD